MPADASSPADMLQQIVDALRERAIEPPSLMVDADAAAAFTGQSRSSLYRAVSAGKFPQPVETPSGPRWRRSDLIAWAERLKPRRRKPAEVRS